jgi:hypothetical protein
MGFGYIGLNIWGLDIWGLNIWRLDIWGLYIFKPIYGFKNIEIFLLSTQSLIINLNH